MRTEHRRDGPQSTGTTESFATDPGPSRGPSGAPCTQSAPLPPPRSSAVDTRSAVARIAFAGATWVLFVTAGWAYGSTGVSLSEGMTSLVVRSPYYDVALGYFKNFTLSKMVLKGGSGDSLITKTGISYVPSGTSSYVTEYGGGLHHDNVYKEETDRYLSLTFDSHNNDLQVKKTYKMYGALPLCEVQYEVTPRKDGILTHHSYFPRIFFPLEMDEITYPVDANSLFTAKSILVERDAFESTLPDFLLGKHFPRRWYAMRNSRTGEGIAVLIPPQTDPFTISVQPDRFHGGYVMSFAYKGPRNAEAESAAPIRSRYYLVPFSSGAADVGAQLEDLIGIHLAAEIRSFEGDGPCASLLTLADEEAFALRAAPATLKLPPRCPKVPGAAVPGKLELSGARGESVSFQLVLQGKEEGGEVGLTFSDLTGEALGSISKQQITTELVTDVYLKDLFSYGKAGLNPDPLVPTQRFPVEIDEQTRIFVKIRIPESAQPGTYVGKMSINGKLSYTGQYSLRVYNFSIPAAPTLRTAFELYATELGPYGGTMDVLRDYLDNMAEHRISAVNVVTPSVSNDSGKLTVDTTLFDAVVTYALDDLGMTTVFMPHVLLGVQDRLRTFLGEKPMTASWQALMDQYLEFMVAHMTEKGWREKLLYFIWDEPYELPAIERMIAEGAAFVAQRDDRAHIYVSTPSPAFREPRSGSPSLVTAEFALAAEGLEPRSYPGTWLSLDGVSRAWIGAESVEARLLPWLAWAYGFEGMELWAVNAWHDPRFAGDPFSFDRSPLEYQLTPVSASRFGGVLLYPGENGRPLNSLRWESLADGMEDFEYLHALETNVRAWENLPPDDSLNPSPRLHEAKLLLDSIRETIFRRSEQPISLPMLMEFRQALGELNEGVLGRPSPPQMRWAPGP